MAQLETSQEGEQGLQIEHNINVQSIQSQKEDYLYAFFYYSNTCWGSGSGPLGFTSFPIESYYHQLKRYYGGKYKFNCCGDRHGAHEEEGCLKQKLWGIKARPKEDLYIQLMENIFSIPQYWYTE